MESNIGACGDWDRLKLFIFSTVFLLSKIDPLKVPAVISYLETLSDLYAYDIPYFSATNLLLLLSEQVIQ